VTDNAHDTQKTNPINFITEGSTMSFLGIQAYKVNDQQAFEGYDQIWIGVTLW